MHFDFLPKVTHNKDAVREYERQENLRLRRRLRWLLIGLPIAVLGAWLLFHWH